MENINLVPLEEEVIEQRINELPEGWTYSNSKIHKTFEFSSFTEGINMLAKLAPFCDEKGHHPDITVEYKKITFDLNRYDIGGKVTNMDFIIAQKIEELVGELEG